MSEYIRPFKNTAKHGGLNEAGEDIVDNLGFISREQKIRNFMNAGIDLYKFRAENYDAHISTPDGELNRNPFRDRGMDFSDFHRQKKKLEEIVRKTNETLNRELQREKERQAAMEKNGATEPQKTASETASTEA